MRARACAIALFVLACAEPVGVDLELVPDPNVNSPASVRDAIDSIVMIVDSPAGLYAPGSERAEGNVQIENADADPSDLEVVATIALPPARLPWIRLVQGTLPDAPLDLRFLGMPPAAGAPAVALGRVSGVRLGAPIGSLGVPFNLRPDLLPPRVTEVLPGDGITASNCEVRVLYVMFSRPIDPSTVEGAFAIEPGTIEALRVDPSGLTVEITVGGLVGEGTLGYVVSVAPTVLDTEGRALDQVPSEPGDQAFSIERELSCGPGTAFPEEPCGTPDVTPLDPMCAYPRLVCVDGWCVPRGCEEAQCASASVCDPITSRCELDCRAWGEAEVCPLDRPRCEPASGTCVE